MHRTLVAVLVITVSSGALPVEGLETPEPVTFSAPCHVHGGGCLNIAGGVGSHIQATFGGDVARQKAAVDQAHGTWQHAYRDGRTVLVSFQSNDARVATCQPDPHGSCPPPDGATRAEFEGTGKVVLGGDGIEVDANFQASVIDVGSCGGSERDSYSITLRRGLDIGQGEVVHELSGHLDCGNVKIDAPWRGMDRGAKSDPAPQGER